MTTYVLSSDSDLPEEVSPATTANESAPVGVPQAALITSDPDWVQSFTPTRPAPAPGNCRTMRPRPRHIHAMDEGVGGGACENGDSDSVMDLVVDSDDGDTDKSDDDDVDDDLPLDKKAVGLMGSASDINAVPLRGSAKSKTDAPEIASSAAKMLPSAKSKTSLPLVAAPRLDENIVLVQAQSAAFDLSGDVGAVGRVKVDESGLFLDIKGVLYSCGLHAINTVCVVTVGDDEARITASLDEVVTLYEDGSALNGGGETLVSGALDEDCADGGDVDEDDITSKQKPKHRTKPVRGVKPKPRAKTKIKTKPKQRAKAAKK
jgi:hypothetical protein